MAYGAGCEPPLDARPGGARPAREASGTYQDLVPRGSANEDFQDQLIELSIQAPHRSQLEKCAIGKMR